MIKKRHISFKKYWSFLTKFVTISKVRQINNAPHTQQWSSWLMASASKAEERQRSGGSNPSCCVFLFHNKSFFSALHTDKNAHGKHLGSQYFLPFNWIGKTENHCFIFVCADNKRGQHHTCKYKKTQTIKSTGAVCCRTAPVLVVSFP